MAQVIKGLNAALKVGLAKAAIQLQPVIMQAVDAYLKDLKGHMGSPTDQGMGWEELKEPDTKFWYKTGSVANHLVIKTIPYKNGFKILAGLPPGSPGYKEALWNEFGWHPQSGEKLIRREVFVPLGEDHLRELLELLQREVSKFKIKIKVNI